MPNPREQIRLFPTLIVVLTVTLSAQMIRALFPLVTFTPGVSPDLIARHLVLVFLSPIALPFVANLLKPQRLLFVMLAALACLRLGLQLSGSASLSLWLDSAGVILALAAQGLLLNGVFKVDHRWLAAGFIAGLALDAALNSAFFTWDYLWQRTPISFLVALLMSGTLLVALWYQRDRFGPPEPQSMGRSLWTVLLGPFWMLQLTILNNPAFVAGLTGPIFADVVVLFGDFLALALSPALSRRRSPVIKLIMLALLGWLLFVLNDLASGWDAALAILVIQVLACTMLFRLLSPHPEEAARCQWLGAIGYGLGCLLFVGLVALYYLGYEVRSPPWTSAVVQAGAGLLFAFGIFRREIEGVTARIRWRLVIVTAVAVPPLCFCLTFPSLYEARPSAGKPQFRFMTYNIHQGANTDGWIDLEGLAEAIEAQKPDVIVLQEVVRGQIITGSTDIADWLGRRLDMDYRFSPAADHTFGNLLLSRFQIRVWTPATFSRGNPIQPRSFIKGLLALGDQGYFNVVGTHLDHLESADRVQEVEELTEAWNKELVTTPRTLLAGDMNAGPGSPEIEVFLKAGLISAQDVTGNSSLFTFPATDPRARIDWIFGSPDLSFTDFVIPTTTASDHRPVAVTVHWSVQP